MLQGRLVATICFGSDSSRVQIGQKINAKIIVGNKTLWLRTGRKG